MLRSIFREIYIYIQLLLGAAENAVGVDKTSKVAGWKVHRCFPTFTVGIVVVYMCFIKTLIIVLEKVNQITG